MLPLTTQPMPNQNRTNFVQETRIKTCCCTLCTFLLWFFPRNYLLKLTLKWAVLSAFFKLWVTSGQIERNFCGLPKVLWNDGHLLMQYSCWPAKVGWVCRLFEMWRGGDMWQFTRDESTNGHKHQIATLSHDRLNFPCFKSQQNQNHRLKPFGFSVSLNEI